ncbi:MULTISPECIES: hypothetical protein [unclassified Leisingera]|uniref:hypothetical protein n=1 Tax=unclassified Leisingera TaxID=2614906 RepID=UPI0010104BF9|nr:MULTISPECIES: hypothetical protein [unclassified Leisingera]MCF6433830.1 hypothetical protein [Leisingera sp. MMG026]QAX32417.1 hypothetical protein ETW24_23840 [Leisingera sp. NJS204]
MKQADANFLHSEENEGTPDLRGAELELLEKARKLSGRSIAFWARLTEGLDEDARALLVSRAHMVSSEFTASSDDLRRDQGEAIALLSLVGQRDRQVFIKALRNLVEFRAGRKN